MSKARWVKWGGIMLVVVAVGAAIAGARRAATFEAEARYALAQQKKVAEQADSLIKVAQTHKQRADSLTKVAKKIATKVVERIVRLPAPPPGDSVIRRYTAPRDSVISEQALAIDLWEVAYDSLGAAYDKQAETSRILLVSHDSLAAVLQRRPKPGFNLFRPDIGPFIGIAVTRSGSIEPVIGVGLQWKF